MKYTRRKSWFSDQVKHTWVLEKWEVFQAIEKLRDSAPFTDSQDLEFPTADELDDAEGDSDVLHVTLTRTRYYFFSNGAVLENVANSIGLVMNFPSGSNLKVVAEGETYRIYLKDPLGQYTYPSPNMEVRHDY